MCEFDIMINDAYNRPENKEQERVKMLLNPKYANRHARIERKQGRHLKRFMRKEGRNSIFYAEKWLAPRKGGAQGLLNAHNEFARTMWFRALAGNVCQEVNATPPRFIPPQPVYILTIIDGQQIVYPDYGEEDGFHSPTLTRSVTIMPVSSPASIILA
jgi:hypothetical protein